MDPVQLVQAHRVSTHCLHAFLKGLRLGLALCTSNEKKNYTPLDIIVQAPFNGSCPPKSFARAAFKTMNG
jgi:hypothetical protein